jgi:hypothetical protein
MLSKEKIRQIFLLCDNKDSEGMYADDVDVIEYAKKIEHYVRIEAMQEERLACIKLVKSLNHEVAKALEDNRKWVDRNFT